MPDNRVINVPGHIRMTCPELLFNPSIHPAGNPIPKISIQQCMWSSISKSDIDVRKDLCKNIILSGGNSMYEGLPDRLKQEITSLAPAGAEIGIIASADRKYYAWKGASTFASLSSFDKSCVTKEYYEEHGASVIHRFCN